MPDLQVLCVIGPRPLDRAIVSGAGLPYERLNVGGIHGMAAWRAGPNLARFALSVPRAAAIVRRFRPDIVLVGGGYVCAPVAVAAWSLRIPLLTLCVDVVPGWAVRLAARLSTATATAFPQSLPLLPGARVTGYPVRDEFLHVERDAARRRLGLDRDENVVVAFGGSLGSRSINTAVSGALEQILPVAHVVHVTGRQGISSQQSAVSQSLMADSGAARYHPYEYLDAAGMADALAAADLAICRAGAATMAELPIVGTPAILIPGEFSAQEGNARLLAGHGAALVIPDRELTSARLAHATLALLYDKPRLAAMAAACRALAQRDAAGQVAALVRAISRQ